MVKPMTTGGGLRKKIARITGMTIVSAIAFAIIIAAIIKSRYELMILVPIEVLVLIALKEEEEND